MESKLFKDVPETEREAMLEANCHDHEVMPVQKFFSEEEITDKRKEFTDNHAVIRRATEELNAAKDIWKEKVRKPMEDNVYLMQNIRSGYVDVEQQVYLMADWNERMIGYYDRYGDLIKSRKMLPHEKQTKITG